MGRRTYIMKVSCCRPEGTKVCQQGTRNIGLEQQWIILPQGAQVERFIDARTVWGHKGCNSAADPYSAYSAFMAVFGKIERNMLIFRSDRSWLTTAGHGISNSNQKLFPTTPKDPLPKLYISTDADSHNTCIRTLEKADRNLTLGFSGGGETRGFTLRNQIQIYPGPLASTSSMFYS